MGETRGNVGITWNYVGVGSLWACQLFQNTLPENQICFVFKGQMKFDVFKKTSESVLNA